MKTRLRLVSMLVALAGLHPVAAFADKPSELLVGKWKDRAEPNDAIIEFVKGGTGTITETSAKKTVQANISWTVQGTYGNACILQIKYVQAKGAKPLPKEAREMTWLIAFDGQDTFVSQPTENKIVFMRRQVQPNR